MFNSRRQAEPGVSEAGGSVTLSEQRTIDSQHTRELTFSIAMQKSRHLYFRWTPRTARIGFIYVLVIPSLMGYLAYQTQVSQGTA